MDFSIRKEAEKPYVGMNSLCEEVDECHRNALPHIFKKPERSARIREFISVVLADKNAAILIAETQSEVICLAYACVKTVPELAIHISSRVGGVDQIIVRDKYRRCGVGKALMERVGQWAGQMKLDRLELSV